MYILWDAIFLGEQCNVLCFNGGTCNKDNCTCKNGFTGKFCQSRKFINVVYQSAVAADVDLKSKVTNAKSKDCNIMVAHQPYVLKELRHDILSHFFDGLKRNTRGSIVRQKGTQMAEDGEDWNGFEMTILKNFANFFKIHELWRSSFKDADKDGEIRFQDKLANFAYAHSSLKSLRVLFQHLMLVLAGLFLFGNLQDCRPRLT